LLVRCASRRWRAALRNGHLARRYVDEFDDKGCSASAEGRAPGGSADIQSLADLGNSYEIVRDMRTSRSRGTCWSSSSP
jgi:hypothetical protein